jgi:hypothetical protein
VVLILSRIQTFYFWKVLLGLYYSGAANTSTVTDVSAVNPLTTFLLREIPLRSPEFTESEGSLLLSEGQVTLLRHMNPNLASSFFSFQASFNSAFSS